MYLVLTIRLRPFNHFGYRNSIPQIRRVSEVPLARFIFNFRNGATSFLR